MVKQLLRDTYDVAYPGVIAVYLDGCPKPGTGPQDIALAIIRAVFKNGYVKNKSNGICWTWCCFYDYRLQKWRRRNDYRDHLLNLHLENG